MPIPIRRSVRFCLTSHSYTQNVQANKEAQHVAIQRRRKKKKEDWLPTQQSDLAIHLLKTAVTESKRKIEVMQS